MAGCRLQPEVSTADSLRPSRLTRRGRQGLPGCLSGSRLRQIPLVCRGSETPELPLVGTWPNTQFRTRLGSPVTDSVFQGAPELEPVSALGSPLSPGPGVTASASAQAGESHPLFGSEAAPWGEAGIVFSMAVVEKSHREPSKQRPGAAVMGTAGWRCSPGQGRETRAWPRASPQSQESASKDLRVKGVA